jgi:hypothetical protein
MVFLRNLIIARFFSYLVVGGGSGSSSVGAGNNSGATGDTLVLLNVPTSVTLCQWPAEMSNGLLRQELSYDIVHKANQPLSSMTNYGNSCLWWFTRIVG